ncbi:tol-pal system protein YbgF [Acidihalobacter ferrooxydans]|uniref:tol-pal system protein YbgF n=1 Tax=Acidihalobacter ferrooxydans TaxID=1765967 RepID=UPI0009FA7638|nr:tol-pal system protein YbgF [Acidihalobacter ferrooxydans]
MRAFRLTLGAAISAAMLVAAVPPGWAADPSQSSSAQSAGNSQALVQFSLQLSNLQQQIRELRGKNQVLQHEIDTLRNRQRQLYMSTDQRLQALEAAAGGSGNSVVMPMSNTSNSGGVPGVAIPASGTTGNGAASVAPSTTASNQSATVSAAYNGKDLTAYQQAFDLLKNSHYQSAISAFKTFEKKYPQSPYVANAEYWTGEALYVETQYSQALAQFQKVVNNYPQSNKVSASLLKVGYCQYELKQWAAARKTLETVVSQYPGTTSARLAADRLSRMKSEGH